MDVTPGVDRVIHFSIGGHQFGFHRPSRRDQAAVTRLFAARLAGVTGLPLEAELHNAYGGQNLLWDCRLEVGLVPQRTRTGQLLALGETAPTHWLDATADGETVVSFTHVTPEEYDAVCAYLDEQVYKKKPRTPSSTRAAIPAAETPEEDVDSATTNPASNSARANSNSLALAPPSGRFSAPAHRLTPGRFRSNRLEWIPGIPSSRLLTPPLPSRPDPSGRLSRSRKLDLQTLHPLPPSH